MANILLSNLTATWANGSNTFTAIKMNVTDSASASGSLLMDLLVGGTSKFEVTKTGTIVGLPSANVSALTVTGYSLTGANTASMIDLAGTWNTTGLPTAIKLNVTDTASNASSLLMDLQVGGSSRFKVNKIGTLSLDGAGISLVSTNTVSPVFTLTGSDSRSFSLSAGSSAIIVAGKGQFWLDNGYIGLFSGNGATIYGTIYGEAANVLGLRVGTNAQTFRIYNTYTDASNYERGKLEWSSNVLRIGTEKAGTGTARALELQTDGTTRVTISTTGTTTFAGAFGYGTGSGGAVTQDTSRTTGVTLDKTNGAITLVSAAGTTSWQSFTVTNSTVAATDTVIVNQKSGTDLYQIFVTNVASGSFQITFATTGGTTTEQPVFNFAVIKAVAS